MFSLFHNLMDTFKEVEKQNKILQMSLKRKQKPDQCSIKERRAMIRETLEPYFGQDQIDIFLRHQTKRVKEWSKDSIFQAETLRRCMSRNSYRKLRESKIFPLPSLTALKVHLERFGGMPYMPNVFPATNGQVCQESKLHSNNKVSLENLPSIEQSKRKERRQTTTQSVAYDESAIKIHTHSEMPIVPVSSNSPDGIMMVPVVHETHLPTSHHEVVLAVDSIIP